MDANKKPNGLRIQGLSALCYIKVCPVRSFFLPASQDAGYRIALNPISCVMFC
jgi:hypothetical protein